MGLGRRKTNIGLLSLMADGPGKKRKKVNLEE